MKSEIAQVQENEMGRYIFRQPNGLLGVFSSVVDCPILYNFTKEDLIDYFVEEYRQGLVDNFKHRHGQYLDANWDKLLEDSQYLIAEAVGEMTAPEWKQFFEDVETCQDD